MADTFSSGRDLGSLNFFVFNYFSRSPLKPDFGRSFAHVLPEAKGLSQHIVRDSKRSQIASS